MLWIDRDKTPDADGDFSNAPIFNWNDGKLKFDTNWFDNQNENEMLRTGHGFGRKSLWELKDILESMGLCFGMKIEGGFLRKPTGEVVKQ